MSEKKKKAKKVSKVVRKAEALKRAVTKLTKKAPKKAVKGKVICHLLVRDVKIVKIGRSPAIRASLVRA